MSRRLLASYVSQPYKLSHNVIAYVLLNRLLVPACCQTPLASVLIFSSSRPSSHVHAETSAVVKAMSRELRPREC